MIGIVKAISSFGITAAVETVDGYSIFNFPPGSISVGNNIKGQLHSIGNLIVYNITTNKTIPICITSIHAPSSSVINLLSRAFQ